MVLKYLDLKMLPPKRDPQPRTGSLRAGRGHSGLSRDRRPQLQVPTERSERCGVVGVSLSSLWI